MPESEPSPIVAVPAGEGEARWWYGLHTTIKLTADQTDGNFTLIDVISTAGRDVPRHVHTTEDESFCIIEGSIAFRIGDRTIDAGPGDTVFAPRNVPHAYVFGPEERTRVLILFSPGGFEAFIRDTSEPAGDRTQPADEQPDLARLGAAAEAYGAPML